MKVSVQSLFCNMCPSCGKKQGSWEWRGKCCQAIQASPAPLKHEAVEPSPLLTFQFCRCIPLFSVWFHGVWFFPQWMHFVAFSHTTISERDCAIGKGSPSLDREERAFSWPFQRILTLCSKVMIEVVIIDAVVCFIAMRKPLISASVLPSCS